MHSYQSQTNRQTTICYFRNDAECTSWGPSFQTRSPATPRASWFRAMTSSFSRMLRCSAVSNLHSR